MLKIHNISKKYNQKPVLHEVSFDIPIDSINGIIGPNGAGKSTLMNIITGFLEPTAGEILLNNQKLNNFDEKNKLFAYMPEQLVLYPDMTVSEYIQFIEQATSYANPNLKKTLNLQTVKNKIISTLSKGYHQRLKLFTALSNNKKFAVLDEPFDGFDPIQLLDIIQLLKNENKNGKTLILSIHQLFDAEKICDNYILMNQGEKIIDGSLEKLRANSGCSKGTLENIFLKVLQ